MSLSLTANGGPVASCGPAARSSSRLVAPTRLLPRMYAQPDGVRPLPQVSALPPAYRQCRHRRPLLANCLSLHFHIFRRHDQFSTRAPYLVFPCRNLVFAFTPYIGLVPAYALRIPRVALAGGLMGTESARITPQTTGSYASAPLSDVLVVSRHVLAQPFGDDVGVPRNTASTPPFAPRRTPRVLCPRVLIVFECTVRVTC